MIFEACILGVTALLSAIIIANTIENVANDFFRRWDSLDLDENNR